MDTGGDRGERDESANDGGSGISRRHFVAGGLFSIAGAAQFVTGRTASRFQDSASSSGSVGVATLNRSIVDDSTSSDNVRYEIGYQVILDSGFQSIDITVENLTDGYEWNYSRTTQEDVVIHDQSGGSNWGWNDEYRITFEVNITGGTNPVMSESVTDTADGTDPENNDDVSQPNSPELDWLVVDDGSHDWNGAIFDVYYEVTNPSNFGEIDITFRDTEESWATKTKTETSAPIGTASYSESAYGDTFEIVADVKNTNGLTVDTVRIDDVADGTDPTGHGDPGESDSPQIDSFTVYDNTNGNVEFEIDYDLTNANRLDRVDAIFQDLDQGSPEQRVNGPAQQSGTITYTTDGWRSGHNFEIQLEVYETRDGVTFPVDSGIVEDTAGGSDSPTTYP